MWVVLGGRIKGDWSWDRVFRADRGSRMTQRYCIMKGGRFAAGEEELGERVCIEGRDQAA
jgi:hypothetical protein